MTSTSRVQEPVYPGEKRMLRWSIPDQLDGAQITAVTFTVESPVTEVALTKTIFTRTTTNDSVKAIFDFTSAVAGVRYSVTAKMTSSAGEEIIETIVVPCRAIET